MKKKFIFPTIAALLLLILVSTTFAALAAGESQLPFKGSLQAVETSVAVFPTLYVDGNGSGYATHLGRYTMSFQAEINIPTQAGSVDATFIAANGDSLFAEGQGQGTTTSNPNVVSIVEVYTIIGGTGRFTGATGNFTVERLLDRPTGISSGAFDGYLVLP